ncbi:hypothetical protein FRUB_10001 [Fimbriiglobus ruber]|uniref:Uncharacterized protein n=1 Tax=Fimbriiglobus ruber TaxID=1908690 RepID=A0A225DDC8_9BACT|nr:hypothetical protein FRUB_10001 [Fimbriiglobus ruber]
MQHVSKLKQYFLNWSSGLGFTNGSAGKGGWHRLLLGLLPFD